MLPRRRRFPPAAQRSIEIDHCNEAVPAKLGNACLGRKKLLLRVEYFEVRGETRLIAQRCELHRFAIQLRRAGTLRLRFGNLLVRHEIRRHFAERGGEIALVREARLFELRDRQSPLIAEASGIEDRAEEAALD